MLTSQSLVDTDAPERYAKQLAGHFARKVTVEEIPDGHRAHLGGGHADILVRPEGLLLVAFGEDAEVVGQVQAIVGGHLERFGQRHHLRVEWAEVAPAG